MMNRTPLTVIVLTRDEEQLIARCLTALQWADEVLVLDSGSSDRTQEIAAAAGATVVEQPFLGWAAQRNAALAHARNDWVMFVDTDEVVSTELARSVARAMAGSPVDDDAYAVDRRNEFLGVLMPNSQRTSAKLSLVRLFNRSTAKYDPAMLVHEQVLVRGSIHLLDGPLLHWRQQTVAEMTERIVRYAQVEARAAFEDGRRGSIPSLIGKPPVRFVWHFVLKGEWRLGRRGAMHATLRAIADATREAMLLEKSVKRGRVHPEGYEPHEPAAPQKG